MTIRPYIHYDDIKNIAKEYESSVFKVPSEAMVQHSKIYGAFEKGEPIAYVLITKEYGDGLYSIPSLATRKGFEGRGIMKQLILEAFISSGAKKVLLEVHPDNVSARALYKSLGFVETENPNVQYSDGKNIIMSEVTLEN